MTEFKRNLKALRKRHEALLAEPNKAVEDYNGIYTRYVNPVLTAEHTPL